MAEIIFQCVNCRFSIHLEVMLCSQAARRRQTSERSPHGLNCIIITALLVMSLLSTYVVYSHYVCDFHFRFQSYLFKFFATGPLLL